MWRYFCCHAAKLIVELDGDQHGVDQAIARDAQRTVYLNSRGYKVVRFTNGEVRRDLNRVVDNIAEMAQPPTRNSLCEFRSYAGATHPRKGEVKEGCSSLACYGLILWPYRAMLWGVC
jgi:hypothetical protein